MPIRRVVDNGHELSASDATLLTFGANLVQGGGVLVTASIANLHTARRFVSISLVEEGGSVGDAKPIFAEYVPPNRTVTVPGGPWWVESGGFVSAKSDAASSKVAVRLSAFEEYISSAG